MRKSKHIQLLVLDDEDNILRSIKRVFMREPFAVYTTTDSGEAFEILKREPVKVVMSDQRMPNVTGVEFLGRVKELYPDTIRILFTGHSDVRAVEDAINIGEVFRFINKPWKDEELKDAVAQAVHFYDTIKKQEQTYESTRINNKELSAKNMELKSLYDLQKKFTSSISQELKDPLDAAKESIDLVVAGDMGPLTAEQRSSLAKTQANIHQLERTVSGILDISDMESGKLVLHREAVQIEELAGACINSYMTRIDQDKIQLRLVVEKSIPEVMCDYARISQVLDNLLDNAIKFSQNGEIIVYCYKSKVRSGIEVCVQDHGPGIHEENFGKVFYKFSQLEGSIQNETGGTGLGLAICKEILTQHGGDIWLESIPGKGSMFFFYIPLEA